MNEDLVIPIIWIISGIVSLVIGVKGLIKAQNKEEITNAWMIILVSFTPGIVFIGFVLILVGLIMLIIEGPTYLIGKIKHLP